MVNPLTTTSSFEIRHAVTHFYSQSYASKSEVYSYFKGTLVSRNISLATLVETLENICTVKGKKPAVVYVTMEFYTLYLYT